MWVTFQARKRGVIGMGKIIPAEKSFIASVGQRQVNQGVGITIGGWVEVNIKEARLAEKGADFTARELHVWKQSALAHYTNNGRMPDAHAASRK